MDREAWRAAVHRVEKSWTWLRNWTELNLTKDFLLPLVESNKAEIGIKGLLFPEAA